MQQAEEKMYEELEHALKKAMDNGEISRSNPRLGALLFVSLVTTGNNMDTNFKNSFRSLDDLVTQIVDFYWDGLANQS